MKNAKTRAPHLGRYLLVVFSVSLLAFVLSALITSRILNRVMVAEVPEITGKSVEAARGALKLKHLGMDIAEFRFDAHIPLNAIISQDPKPGQTVKSGRLVRVVVSRGSQTVKLPALAGTLLRDVNALLNPKGIHIGKVTQLYSQAAAKNVVLEQWPLAGEFITQGSKVQLLVSAGPRPVKWINPNLKGLDYAEALRILKFLGLKLQAVRRQTDDRVPANTVLEQKPLPGERVAAEQAASLLLSQRSDAVQTPGRYLTLRYKMPAAHSPARLKMILKDDLGLREVHNAMERPQADIAVPLTVHGTPATLTIMLNGQVVEERPL